MSGIVPFASSLVKSRINANKRACIYNPEKDWFIYIGRKADWTPRCSTYRDLCLEGQVIGFIVLSFLKLARADRDQCIAATGIDLDYICGIEQVWLQNMKEDAPVFDALEADFLEEFKHSVE